MSNITGGMNVLSKMTENNPSATTNIIDLLSLIKGSRFAVTFLDYAKKELAVNDEMLLDKITGKMYYKNKEGTIISVGADSNVPEDIEGRLITLEEAIIEAVRETREYVDSVFSEAVLGTSFRMVHFSYTIAVTENRSTFKIPLESFKKDKDLLIVTSNSALPSPKNPTLGYVVDDNRNITFATEFEPGMEIYLLILKNVPVGAEDAFDGYYIKNGTISEEKLSPILRDKINNPVIEWDMFSDGLKEKLIELIGEGGGGTNPGGGPVTGVIVGDYIVSSDQPVNQAENGMWIQVPEPFAAVASESIEVGDKNNLNVEHGHLVFDTANK